MRERGGGGIPSISQAFLGLWAYGPPTNNWQQLPPQNSPSLFLDTLLFALSQAVK